MNKDYNMNDLNSSMLKQFSHLFSCISHDIFNLELDTFILWLTD